MADYEITGSVGKIGQITGPFYRGDRIYCSSALKVKLGFIIDNDDIKYFNNTTILLDYLTKIENGIDYIVFGKTGIYQLDEALNNPTIMIPQDIDNIIINYIIVE